MAKTYLHLSTQERAIIMCMRDDKCSMRSIAKRLCRSVSAVSRELKRTCGSAIYDANQAHQQSQSRRFAPSKMPKLHTSGALFTIVRYHLNLHWSP